MGRAPGWPTGAANCDCGAPVFLLDLLRVAISDLAGIGRLGPLIGSLLIEMLAS